MKASKRSSKSKANSRRSLPALPIAPTRRRFDVDSFVGLACVLLLPVALWFA